MPSGEGPPPVPFPGGAGGAPMYWRISICCPIVHRFVVIQYTSSPAGYLYRMTTNTTGSSSIRRRWLGSAVAVATSVDATCEPT